MKRLFLISILLLFTVQFLFANNWCAAFVYKLPIPKPQMHISNQGVHALIMNHEGLRLHSYIGPDGKRYNGYGYRTNSFKKITKLQATKQLQKRIVKAERLVNNANLDLNQYQFDALVSLTDNMGHLPNAVIKAINEKQDITKVFAKYKHCKHNGKMITLRGLTKRRLYESRLVSIQTIYLFTIKLLWGRETVTRKSHKLQIVGSTPTPATIIEERRKKKEIRRKK